MFDPSEETPIPLADVPRTVPWLKRPGGKAPHVSSVFRWTLRGIRGHKLEVLRIGGTLCTSENALKRFFNAITDAGTATPRVGRPSSKKRVERAKAELAAAGI
jgi:hypothetical protein